MATLRKAVGRLPKIVSDPARQVHRYLKIASSRRRDLPGVLLIGAEKAGSTSLYRWLISHPWIARPERKEIRYLTGPENDLGLLWYKSHFPIRRFVRGANGERRASITLDATPSYLFDPWSPARAQSVLPEAKIIVLLRNPIHRAWSHYLHWLRMGWESEPFEEAIYRPEELIDALRLCLSLRNENPRAVTEAFGRPCYLARSIYADQLARWFESFDRNRVLVVKSEEFFSEPEVAYKRITNFLELPAFRPTGVSAMNRRPDRSVLNESLIPQLAEYFAPHNLRLSDLLGTLWTWN